MSAVNSDNCIWLFSSLSAFQASDAHCDAHCDVECDDLRLAVGVDLRRALAAFLARVADVVLDARPGHEQELLVGPDADGAGLRVGRLNWVKSA